ncbi:hypothetical protein [Pseudomonas sp. A-B-19]|uniref:hypothetical protein n=1 Tax=Pseudomonas sp. A-B-19 TaxID=2832405 RepID=UPI003989B012
MRGVFWAPMGEVDIPQHIAGSAFGIGCLIGYAPAQSVQRKTMATGEVGAVQALMKTGALTGARFVVAGCMTDIECIDVAPGKISNRISYTLALSHSK